MKHSIGARFRMEKVVIVFSRSDVFFRMCAEKVKACSVGQHITTIQKDGTNLNMEEVTESLVSVDAPVVFAAFCHGNNYGFGNDDGFYFIDCRDSTLYRLANDVVYTCACESGSHDMVSNMRSKGVKVYWGYDCEFTYFNDEDYAEAAVSGLKSMFEGSTLKEAKEILVDNMTNYANRLTSPLDAGFVYENIDHLTVLGSDDYILKDSTK